MRIEHNQPLDKIPEKSMPLKRRIVLPSMGLKVSERRILLRAIDVLLIITALIFSLFFRTDVPVDLNLLDAWKWFLTLIVTWFIFAAIFDIYDLARAASPFHSVRDSGITAAMTSVVYLAIPWLTPFLVNRSQGFLFVVFSVFFIVIWRYIYARVFTQPTFQQRALILGNDPAGIVLVNALRSDFAQQEANPFRGTGHIMLGYVVGSSRSVDDKSIDGLPVLGSESDLVPLVEKLAVDEVILALSIEKLENDALKEAVLDCFELGVPLTGIAAIYERLTGRVPVAYAGRILKPWPNSKTNQPVV